MFGGEGGGLAGGCKEDEWVFGDEKRGAGGGEVSIYIWKVLCLISSLSHGLGLIYIPRYLMQHYSNCL